MIVGSRVVFDCNTLLQAVSSPAGPAGRCVQLALDSKLDLFLSPTVLSELRRVAGRPKVIAKLHLVPERFEKFVAAIEMAGIVLESVDEMFSYARDPADAHYVNLALAAGAHSIISRDRDLLDLMTATLVEAIDFRSRFPRLRILDPVQFLREFDAESPSS